MKNINSILQLILFLSLGYVLPMQAQVKYNEVDVTIDVDGKYQINRSKFLTPVITFNLPEYETPGYAHRIYFTDPPLADAFEDLSANNLSVTFSFATPGEKTIQIRRYYQNIQTWVVYQEFKLTIYPSTAPYMSPDIVHDVTTELTWDPLVNACANPYPSGSPYLVNTIRKAKAVVKYAPGHNAIIKPIVFVDGIDFSSLTTQVTDDAIGQGEAGIIRYGFTGWDVLVMGGHEGDTPAGYVSEFAMYPAAFQQLLAMGYDIIVFDFEDGADYLQKNAILLEKFIQQLNGYQNEAPLKQPDPATGLVNGNVIMGASMGGMISRMALANLEAQGIDHCTDTYISFDAPQKGANIPLGLQAAAYYLFNYAQDPNLPNLLDKIGSDISINKFTNLWDKIERPATRQLLVEHFGNAVQDGDIKVRQWDENIFFPFSSAVDYGCLRESFELDLEQLGYPKLTRNVAISCGSGNAQNQGYNNGDQFFAATAGLNLNTPPPFCNINGIVVEAGAWALNGGSCDYTVFHDGNENIELDEDNVIFAVAVPSASQLINNLNNANICPLNPFDAYAKVIEDFPHYDNSPGSFRYDLSGYDFDETFAKFLLGASLVLDANGGIVAGRDRQTFIPSISTIDLNGPMHNANLWKNLSQEDLVATGNTPFDAYYLPATNLKHVEIDQGIIDWLSDELETTGGNIYSVLPYNGQTTYNFGNGARNRIPSVTINDGGVLGINNKGNTGYLNEPPSGQSVFETWTRNVCDGFADIVVASGGKMILGNHLTTYPTDPPAPPPGDNLKGIVHLTEGSTLRVEANGILRVARGSQLIVEEGAELILEAGARVDLWWSESTIHVKGKLTVHGKINFTGSGFFQFDPTHSLDLVNDLFVLHGTDQQNRFIRINKGTVLDIGGGYIELKNGTVEYGSDARIEIGTGGGAFARYITFRGYGGQNGDALVGNAAAKIDVWQSDFENMAAGIFATGGSAGNFTRTYWCDFTNVIDGVWAENHPKISVQNSNFYAGSNSVAAVSAKNVEFVAISGGSILNYPEVGNADGAIDLRNVNSAIMQSTDMLDNHIAVLLSNVPNFGMWGGSISQTNTYVNDGTNPNIGIYAPQFGNADNYSNVSLYNGATIENNDVGVQITQGGILDGGQGNFGVVTMKCAKLIHNETGVQGTDVLLEIDAMTHSNCTDLDYVNSNTFINSWTSSNPERIFNICYNLYSGDFTEISARGNYWGGFAPNPTFDYFLRNTPCWGDSDITLIFQAYATTPPTACDHNNCGLGTPIVIDNSKRLAAPSKATEFIVSPNPTLDYFAISWLGNVTKAAVEIYNPLGQVVLRKTVENVNELTVDASQWPKGVYLINVHSDEETKAEMLIVN